MDLVRAEGEAWTAPLGRAEVAGGAFGLRTAVPASLVGPSNVTGARFPVTAGAYRVRIGGTDHGTAFEVVAGPGEGQVPPDALPDGRHFGRVEAVDLAAQPATLGFDLAEFLTGDEALKALVEDGFSEDDYANDYCVRNRSPRLRTLPVADDVAVEEVDWPDGTSPRPSDLPTLAARINARGDEQPSFWLEVRDGRVLAIEEQYLA